MVASRGSSLMPAPWRPGGLPTPRLRRVVLAVTSLASLVALATLTALVIIHRHEPLQVDTRLHAWSLQRRTPALTTAAVVLTATGTGVIAYVLAALAGALAGGGAIERRIIGAVAGVAALLLGQGIRLLLADAVDRARPPQADWAGTAGGAAYPSGHTTTSALVAALICVAAARAVQGRARPVARAAALGWATLVGLTRIYLGVHWPTDVLAGWLLAATLVTAAMLLIETVPDARARARERRDPVRRRRR
jgi:membrane-associated phospholipid phosphatase